jgi:CheY-like chemotaxis protein
LQQSPVSKSFRNEPDRKVLIVEDNLVQLETLNKQLTDWELKCTITQSPVQALQILSKNELFDLIITDFGMQEMDGEMLASKIKEILPKLPVILLSPSGIQISNINMDLFSGIVSKPVKQYQLFNVLEEVLTKKVGNALSIQTDKGLLTESFAQDNPFEILIAEDNIINQKLIVKILSKLGYSPDTAADGVEVLNMLKKKKYDLILMDIQMPNMDGIEATHAIRRENAQIPFIVAMTANAFDEDRQNCINAGMTDYLAKPFKLEALLNILTRLSQEMV